MKYELYTQPAAYKLLPVANDTLVPEGILCVTMCEREHSVKNMTDAFQIYNTIFVNIILPSQSELKKVSMTLRAANIKPRRFVDFSARGIWQSLMRDMRCYVFFWLTNIVHNGWCPHCSWVVITFQGLHKNIYVIIQQSQPIYILRSLEHKIKDIIEELGLPYNNTWWSTSVE